MLKGELDLADNLLGRALMSLQLHGGEEAENRAVQVRMVLDELRRVSKC